MVLAGADNEQPSAGMDRGRVVELWGEPRGLIRDGNVEVLYFLDGSQVRLEEGVVTSIEDAAAHGGVQFGEAADRIREGTMHLPTTGWTVDVETSHQFMHFEGEEMSPAAAVALAVTFFGILFLMIAAQWRIHTKAGERGWTCLVPIYNAVVMLRIAGKPWWWLLLMMIPVVNFVMVIVAMIALAERFGKGVGFGLGLFFLPLIFSPVLAFGKARYIGHELDGGASRQFAE